MCITFLIEVCAQIMNEMRWRKQELNLQMSLMLFIILKVEVWPTGNIEFTKGQWEAR
jgi:predicted nucleic acid-binding Zn ribbon protein